MTECPALTSRTEDNNFLTAATYKELAISTFVRTPGTTVTLDCFDGLKLNGPTQITCRADGTWSYGANKPTCTVARLDEGSDNSDDEMLLIGIIGGVAALIVIILIILMICVCCKARQSPGQKKFKRRRDGLSRRDIAMYARQQSLYSRSNREYPDDEYRYTRDNDVTSHDYDHGTIDTRGYEERPHVPWRTQQAHEDWTSQLGSTMYLPRDSREARLPYPESEAYSQDWVSRGSMYGTVDDDYQTLPSVHGRRRPDPYLWRNA